MKLIVVQAIGVVITVIGSIFAGRGRRKVLGWILVSIGSGVYIVTSAMVAIKATENEKSSHEQTEKIARQIGEIAKLTKRQIELTNKLFEERLPQVMQAPKVKRISPIPVSTGHIQITSPYSGSQVSQRTYLEGFVSDPRSEVWVVIHPMEVSSYWVQPSITVRENGTWKVMAYFGRAGDVGKRFEIMALANPKKRLTEAEILNEWPEAQWRSDVIEVIRG